MLTLLHCRPFAFVQFADYEQAAEAFYTLDQSFFHGRSLRIAFARNSIVMDGDLVRQQAANRFEVDVNTGTREANARGSRDGSSTNRDLPVDGSSGRRNLGQQADKQFQVSINTGNREPGNIKH